MSEVIIQYLFNIHSRERDFLMFQRDFLISLRTSNSSDGKVNKLKDHLASFELLKLPRGTRSGKKRKRKREYKYYIPVRGITNIKKKVQRNKQQERSTSNLIHIDCRHDQRSVPRVPNVFLANVRSLAKKIDDLDVVFRLKCVDLALITETWLSNSIPDTVIEIPGYSLLRKDRVERRGGGIYIKHTLSFKVLDDLSCPDIESVWVYLRPPKLPRGFSCLVVAVIYRPPGQSQASNRVLTDYIISSVDKIRRTYPDAGLIIGGDFNRLNVAPICSNCALKQVITLPTRGNAILDLLFTS